jgi:hypothetical protein
MKITVSCAVAQRSLVETDRRFITSLKRQSIYTRPEDSRPQKAVIFINVGDSPLLQEMPRFG